MKVSKHVLVCQVFPDKKQKRMTCYELETILRLTSSNSYIPQIKKAQKRARAHRNIHTMQTKYDIMIPWFRTLAQTPQEQTIHHLTCMRFKPWRGHGAPLQRPHNEKLCNREPRRHYPVHMLAQIYIDEQIEASVLRPYSIR